MYLNVVGEFLPQTLSPKKKKKVFAPQKWVPQSHTCCSKLNRFIREKQLPNNYWTLIRYQITTRSSWEEEKDNKKIVKQKGRFNNWSMGWDEIYKLKSKNSSKMVTWDRERERWRRNLSFEEGKKPNPVAEIEMRWLNFDAKHQRQRRMPNTSGTTYSARTFTYAKCFVFFIKKKLIYNSLNFF